MRLDHRRQVRDPLVDVELGVEALPVPDEAHEPLQAEAHARRGMGLRHGDVDQDGVVEDILDDLHPVQDLPLGNP